MYILFQAQSIAEATTSDYVYTAIGDEESWPHWWFAFLKLRVRA